MHLYVDIGDASSSLRRSTSSWLFKSMIYFTFCVSLRTHLAIYLYSPQSTMTLDGNVLTQVQKYDKGADVTYIRTFNEADMVTVSKN